MNNNNFFSTSGVVVATLSLISCSTVDQKVEEYKAYKKELSYESSVETRPLEVPPDLTTSTIQDLYQVPGGVASLKSYEVESGVGGALASANEILPQQDEIDVVSDGHQRWLVVQATPEQLWSKLREFWLKNGFLIDREDPRIGIMETDWAENRADIPEGPIRGFLKSALDALYSTGTRDKFRLRLERTDREGVTELFLSHRRMEEVASGESFVWQPHPAMPELEAEVLSRIMSFLGMEAARANTALAGLEGKGIVERARLVDTTAEEGIFLLVKEGFPRTWRRAGHALDRVGFTVEDRDRSRGLYYVRYIDPFKDNEQEGVLDKLKFWGDDQPVEGEYRILVESHENVSRILVQNAEGQPDRSGTARRILTLLHEQLK